MKIYVGGVNAVGKSTLLKEVAKKLGYNYTHATTGLLDYLGFGKDYEKLRAVTQEKRDLEYAKYIDRLLHDRDQDLLLDAHYLGLVRGKVDQVTGPWIKEFDLLVLISAPLDDVWRRIKNDSKLRDRALFPADMSEVEMKSMLSRYQEQTSEEFKRLSKLNKKPSLEIVNEENELEASVQKLASFIDHSR